MWSYAVSGDLALSDRVLFVAGQNGKLTAFTLEAPPTSAAPMLEITLDRATYTRNDTVKCTGFRVMNLSSLPTRVHLKLWLTIPDTSPFYILDIGGDGGFALPGGFDRELGPVSLFTVTATFPPGSYDFSSRMLDPVSGAILSEDLNSFVIN